MHKVKSMFKNNHGGHSAGHSDNSAPSSNPSSAPAHDAPRKRITWPPKVQNIETVGEVIDTRGCNCPRDIGRSIEIGNQHFYLFGDAYHFDKKGDFCGVSNNSVAHVPNPNEPCKSNYCCSETKVPPFIPQTAEEKAFDEQHKDENWRKTCWPFGGFVEDEPKGSGNGWLYFDVAEAHGGEQGPNHGVRVARISLQSGHHVKAERTTPDERIFPKEYPQFGHKAVVSSDGYIHCLGSVEMQNYMARVSTSSDPSKGSNYEYWTKDGNWTKDFPGVENLGQVLSELGQGAIVKMPGCGPGGCSFMMLGCNNFGDGNILMGWAFTPTGPWSVETLGKAPGFFKPDAMRYAIFPHVWAYDWNAGQLGFSWSDNGQMGGAVVQGRITFQVEDAS